MENTQANILARLVASPLLDLHAKVFFEAVEDPSIKELELVLPTDDEPCWVDPMANYLCDGILLTNQKKAWKIRHQAHGTSFMRTSYISDLFHYLYWSSKVEYVLQEVHKGLCRSYLGGKALLIKILMQGYYWPTMYRDSVDFIKQCDQCERYANI